MRKIFLCTCVSLTLVFAIELCTGMALAQPVPDLTAWNGKWIKMRFKASKGLVFSDPGSMSGPISQLSGSGNYYVCATNENAVNPDMVNLIIHESIDRSAVLVGVGSIQWDVGSNVNWVGQADFSIYVLAEQPYIFVSAKVIVQGALDGGAMKSGKIKSIGGGGWGRRFEVPDDYGVFGAILKGTVVTKLPFSQVPPCP